MTTNETLEDLALAYRCNYCGALPELWCQTVSGKTTYMLHGARTNPIVEAFGMGYSEAMS